jgi:hypothetical protein
MLTESSPIDPVVPHVERIIAPSTGNVVLIGCECPLGRDHTYADWLTRFGRAMPATP